MGRSGCVRGDGTDHTKTLSRTLAGFGLTGHGGSRFSCFWEILETHFITKYLQIGHRASRLVLGFFLNTRGFWLNGLRRKSILENDPQQQIFPGKLGNRQNRHFPPNSFPAIGVLAGLIEGRWSDLDAGRLAGAESGPDLLLFT